MKALKQLGSNPSVQYNKIQLLEKTLLLETVRQLIHHYIPEIEFHQTQQCENVLAIVFDLLHFLVAGVYRFSKRVFDFQENIIIKLTKRLLMGHQSESNGYSEMPSMLMVHSQTLPLKIFLFLSALSESGLAELSHFVSVMDIQGYHQTNLREVQEELSKVII